MKYLVAPSVLAADFGNLAKDLEMINSSDADWLHVDIMDGRFVPNISFGPDIVKVMKSHCEKPLDVHLMIEEPEKYITHFRDAGASTFSVHLEACRHLHRVVQEIKAAGMKAGVAINPHTTINQLENVIEMVDLVVLMSVNPGFGGQKFIYETLAKIRKLKLMIETKNSNALIEIDGGVGLQNAESILKAGADVLVAGSSVFKSDNPVDTIHRLKNIDLNTYL